MQKKVLRVVLVLALSHAACAYDGDPIGAAGSRTEALGDPFAASDLASEEEPSPGTVTGGYRGPGDVVGRRANNPAGGGYGWVCSPLDRNICVVGEYWEYVLRGLGNGRYRHGCDAFAQEAGLMRAYYLSNWWTGYPEVTCAWLKGKTGNMYPLPAYPHGEVACSGHPPISRGQIQDLGWDVASTHTFYRLCQAELAAGHHR